MECTAASGSSTAMFAARVRIPEKIFQSMTGVFPVAMTTIMVSPTARPSPIISAEKMPALATGRPRASLARLVESGGEFDRPQPPGLGLVSLRRNVGILGGGYDRHRQADALGREDLGPVLDQAPIRAAHRADLATFVDHALRLDDAAVIRLRVRSEGLVTAWVATGFDVLASRVVGGRVKPADLSVGADTLAAAAAFQPGSVMKFLIGYERAFWNDADRGPTTAWMQPAGLYIGDASLLGSPMLVAFIGGPATAQWRRLGADGRRSRIVECLVQAYGHQAAAPQSSSSFARRTAKRPKRLWSPARPNKPRLRRGAPPCW